MKTGGAAARPLLIFGPMKSHIMKTGRAPARLLLIFGPMRSHIMRIRRTRQTLTKRTSSALTKFLIEPRSTPHCCFHTIRSTHYMTVIGLVLENFLTTILSSSNKPTYHQSPTSGATPLLIYSKLYIKFSAITSNRSLLSTSVISGAGVSNNRFSE